MLQKPCLQYLPKLISHWKSHDYHTVAPWTRQPNSWDTNAMYWRPLAAGRSHFSSWEDGANLSGNVTALIKKLFWCNTANNQQGLNNIKRRHTVYSAAWCLLVTTASQTCKSIIYSSSHEGKCLLKQWFCESSWYVFRYYYFIIGKTSNYCKYSIAVTHGI